MDNIIEFVEDIEWSVVFVYMALIACIVLIVCLIGDITFNTNPVSVTGEVIGLQMGLNFAGFFDPGFGHSSGHGEGARAVLAALPAVLGL